MFFCNIYLPRYKIINKTTLEELAMQILTPCIMVGDFKAHNPL